MNLSTREQIENIVKGVRATIEEFVIEHKVQPNCLVFGEKLASEVARLMGAIGREAAAEWCTHCPVFDQKLFLGLPVSIIDRGSNCGCALFYPLGLFVRPKHETTSAPGTSARPRTGGGKIRKKRR